MPAARRLPLPEFVALAGVLFATVAFSIDAMLPAMSVIAADLTPDAPNRVQLIITVFVLGMGTGTLFTGPLSDAFGRRAVILGGTALYMAAALAAMLAPSLETLLAARLVQGLGAAGPRVAVLAMVRDLYSGREMARVVSFAMLVFTLIPAVAPLIGAGIIWATGWRGIFGAFLVFGVLTSLWLMLRQAETLTPDQRRPFRPAMLARGFVEVLGDAQVILVIAALACVFGALFTTLSTAQLVFAETFGRAASFPFWFAGIAFLSGLGSLLNARIVVRLGMRRVIAATLAAQVALSLAMAALAWTGALAGAPYFAVYLVWTLSIFLMAGLTIGNLNALGMEPLGHLAGLGASLIGSIATVGAVVIAVPVGLTFDGTPLPLALGMFFMTAAALALMQWVSDPDVIALHATDPDIRTHPRD